MANLELDSFHPILDNSLKSASPAPPHAAAEAAAPVAAGTAFIEVKQCPVVSHTDHSSAALAAMSSPTSAISSAGYVQLVRFRRRQPDAYGSGGAISQFPMDQSTKLEVGDRLVLSGERIELTKEAFTCGNGEEDESGHNASGPNRRKVVAGFGQNLLHHCVAGVIVSLDGDTVILGSDGTLPAVLQHLAQPYSATTKQEKGGDEGEEAAAALVDSLRSVVFRLDKFETTAGTSTARRSLVHLFTADARLADLANKEERASNKAANEKGGSSCGSNTSGGGGVAASSLERKLLTDQAPKMRSLIVNLRPPTFSIDAMAFNKLRALHSNILPPQPSSSMVTGGSTASSAAAPADYHAAEQSWLALKLPGYSPSTAGSSHSSSKAGSESKSRMVGNGLSQKRLSQHRGSQQPYSQQRSSQQDFSSDRSGSGGSHGSADKFVAPPGCSPAALRQEWASMNVDQRMAVVKAVAANDYALILGAYLRLRVLYEFVL